MSLKMIQAFKAMDGGTPTQRFVGWVLADCHNEQTGRCDPGVEYLMKVTGFSNRTIWTALEALETAGHLTADRNKGAGNSYLLHPRSCEPPSQLEAQSCEPPSQPAKTEVVNLLHMSCEPVAPSCEPPSKSCEPPSQEPEEPEYNRKVQPEVKREPKRSKREILIIEARETSSTVAIPDDLDFPDFRQAWRAMCENRESLAASSKSISWTIRAAQAMLSQCSKLGREWAVIELTVSVANSYRGIFPDQKRNPADVRSRPMQSFADKPAPVPASSLPSHNRWATPKTS